MTGPEDYEFDDDGNLRDISDQWHDFQNEGENLPGAFRDDDDDE